MMSRRGGRAAQMKAFAQRQQQTQGDNMMATNLPQRYKRARATGELHLAGAELDELPIETCTLLDHLQPDEKIWECYDLTKMDISHNNIHSLPPEASNLTTLVSLNMCNNKLRCLPQACSRECVQPPMHDCG